MTPHTYKFFLLQALTCVGLFFAWQKGWIYSEVLSDFTYITQTIVVLAGIGLICAGLKRWRGVRFTAKILVLLGLIGTVVGFRIALSGVDPETVGDVSAISGMVTMLVQGMGTALTTTLVGSIGALWLMVHIFFLKGE